jgi:amino acid adenylation domain-containing protein
VVARHEPLRARFTTVDGRPEQIVDPPGLVPLPATDLCTLPEGLRDAEVHRLAVEAASRSFDLTRGPLLRATLLRTGQDEWVLLLAMHHVAADGWSIGVLLRELATLYGAFAAGRPAALPPLPIAYADYAAWQREHLQGERLRQEVEHWRTRLAGIPELRLPAERRLQEGSGSRGTAVPVVLPAALTQRLKALARGAGASLFMTLLAAFELLLARWTGQRDFAVGAPVANRTRPEIEGLVGFFVNTLVLRADLAGDPSFAELLARVERTAVDAFAHQEIPFDKLVEELQPERRLGRTPFFSAALTLLNLPPAAARLPGLELAPLPVRNDTSRFELTLSLADEGDALAGDLEIREGTLSPPAARRMAGHLRVLLEAIVDHPGAPVSALPLLTEGERQQILVEWAGPERDYSDRGGPDRTLSELFEEQAARTPESIAVVCGPAAITYGDLDRRSNQLARWLRHLGAGPETAVSISVERSVEMVVGLLGILKSGAAYLPIDPLNPRERQAFLLEDAGTSVLLTQERWVPSFQSGFEAPGRRILCLDADWSEVAREEEAPLAQLAGPEHVIALLYTSGSTGRPKATVLDGRGFLNLCLWFRDVCPIAPHTHGLLGFSFSFDAAFKNILVPLLVGGRTVLPPPGPYDAAEMLEAIRREQVTFLNTTPSQMAPVLQLAAAEGWSGLESLETLILGGEAARWAELRPWMESGRCRAEILHMYGPSEVSDTVSCHRSNREEIAAADRLPVGRAADNTRMVVVEADLSGEQAGGLQPLPIGVPGELCLAGHGVGRGYLARPELTAEKFVPDPFQAGERTYRTGDLARWRPDGSLEILGRIDHQVKIRGIRVEPPEVEAALAAHPAIGGAVVAAREDAAGEKRLIAWIIGKEGAKEEAVLPERGALRDFLRERLPEVMIPAAFVPLDAFPVNTRGKIDRAALPDPPDPDAEQPEEAGDEPRGAAEELMAELWADVLGRGRIQRRDDFFHLGGHSLLATRLAARVRAAFGVELPVRRLFEHPTVAELTEEVRRLSRQGLPPAPPLLPGPRGGAAPLSFAQRRLWMLHQLSPELTAYHIPAGLRLRGPLRTAILESALAEIVRRHESLRTFFAIVDGEPVQAVASATGSFLPRIDLSALPEDLRDTEARRIAAAESRRPFDLEHGPLLRLLLLRLAREEHVLFLVVHHLVSDGWSTAIFLRELSLFYRQIPLPEPVLQYADWARWQRAWLRGEVLEAQLRWWRERLDSAPRVLDLPTDFPRPPVESPAGAAVSVRLPEELVGALRALGRAEGATLYMVLLGAFQTLLARRAGEATVCAGTHVAGRDRLETERLIGFFVNTLVIRTDLEDAPSGKELIARVREAVLGAFAHQDLPFEKLVEALNPVRDLRWSPLFQAAFTLQNVPREELLLPGLEVEPLEVDNGTTQLDLALTLFETEEGAAGGLRYRTALFAEPTIRRLAGHYEVFLRELVADPGRSVLDLPVLSPEERAQILEWSGAEVAVPPVEETFPALFEAQADRTPDAPAVTHADRTLTYRELDRQANRLARHLRRQGVGPETRVAIRFRRSPEMLVAIVGIWKAGGAYVPIDPATPPERLAFLHEDAGAVLELDDEKLAGLDLTGESEERLGVPAVPGQLAYVIYTSGSTGRPKGTLVSHGSLMAFSRGLTSPPGPLSHRTPPDRERGNPRPRETDVFGWGRPSPGGRECDGRGDGGEVVALNASLAFDASLQMIVQLLAGHSLWIVPEEARRDEEQMAGFLRAAEPGAIDCTPSQLELLLAAMDAVERPPRLVLVGGEPIPPGLWSRLAAHQVTRFWNVYGPTECTVDVAARLIGITEGDLSDRPDLGRPLPGVLLWLLEASGLPAPAGARAEIWIGGPQVARGYLGRSELTADRFRPDPFAAEPGARLYRTGDLARWLPDGRIDLLGRADQQVKLRGHRVELGEVEAHLLAHPDVREAAAGVRPDARGHQRLVAWIVPAVPGSLDLRELRHWLGQRLPDAMLPSAFAVLGSLPITAGGKLDRRSLPDPERGIASRVQANRLQEGTAPADEIEEKLLALFREVLEVDAVEPTDNLFELGGHSMSVFRLATRIREIFGLRIAVPKIFNSPTPAGLAEVLRGMDRDAGLPRVRRVSREGPLPLSLQQQRLWVLHQLAPESTAYHIPAGLRLRGPLDVPALERALTEIVRRHEVLRTSFPLHGGEPVQRIAPIASAAPVVLPVLDLLEEEVPRIAEAEARRPFDLESGPLLRLALLRTAPESHVLLLVVHHLVSDGWSAALFLRELSALYAAFLRNEPSPFPELPVQYADWAVWQREHLRGEVLDVHLRWWTERLADAPRVLDLPTDRPRPPVEDPAGASLEVRLSEPLIEALRRLALGENATLYMALLAGFQTLLARRAGEDTVCVGTHLARRNRLEVEALIGFFVNTVVIRADFAGRPDGRDLIAQVRETVFGAFAHQDVPFERLVHALDPDRDPRWSPLFQVSFGLQNAPHEAPCLPGLEVELLDTDTGATQFDLAVTLSESGAGTIRYRTALFQEATIDRLARHYEALLRGMAELPGRSVLELPLLTDEERGQVLGEWGGSAIEQMDETFPVLFEAQVDRTPDAPAVTFAGTTLTFRGLDRRANRLARHLRRRGVEAETRVAIRLERSPEMLVALLGIWKAGGAYVPFDPATPPERLAWLREDAGAALELSDEDLSALDLSAESEERLGVSVAPEQLAYVIYTSGSTGKPKGTLVSQGALVAFWRGLGAVLMRSPSLPPGVENPRLGKEGFPPEKNNRNGAGGAPQGRFSFHSLGFSTPGGEGLRVSLNAPLLFDASLQQIVQLLSGHCLWIVPEDARRDVDRLAGFLREADLDGFDCTPSQLEVLLAAMDLSDRPPRLVLVGGEPISPALWRRLAAHPRTRFWNVYGPTECTVDATARPIDSIEKEELPDAGRPLPGYRLRLLEATGLPAPLGARAEVWIGGPALARGYLGRPELTADRFRPDPFSGEPGARLYRTGDLGRWRHSPGDGGRIEILGRADQQVKLRGIRIELGEIETALAACPGVHEAVVGVLETRETGAGSILAAWVTPSGSIPPDPDELRRRLRERLPEVMVPSSFTVLEELPRTAGGKLDRRALPAPERGLAGRGGRAAPPRDAVELRLAEIVQELLGLEEVSVQESFFDLGGHSLAAVRLVGRIREVFGTALPVAALFQAPTIEALAALVRQGGEIARSPLVPLRAGEGSPLFLIHPGGGSVFAYLDLVRRLEDGWPVFGLQALGLEPGEEPLRDAGEIAERYLAEIRGVRSAASWRLVGWSFGGIVAFEMARRLRAQGEEVAALVLIDPTDPRAAGALPPDEIGLLAAFARELGISLEALGLTEDEARALAPEQRWALLFEKGREAGRLRPGDDLADLHRRFEVFRAHAEAARAFRPGPYDGPLDLIEAAERPAAAGSWRDLARRTVVLPGDHFSLLVPPGVDALAAAVGELRKLAHPRPALTP